MITQITSVRDTLVALDDKGNLYATYLRDDGDFEGAWSTVEPPRQPESQPRAQAPPLKPRPGS